MKTMPGVSLSHVAQQVTTLATCWKIVRRDGVVLGFTDYHEDLTVLGVLYKAASGLTRATALSGVSDLSVSNMETETILDSTRISRPALLAGLYDFADVFILMVDYTNPSLWQIKLARGKLGEVSVGKNSAQVEFRSLTQLLKQRIGRTHEAHCPYDLGDAKCGVNLTLFKKPATVTTSVSSRVFRASALIGNGVDWFRFGKVTWTSGLNTGLTMEVKTYTDSTGEITLSLPMPFNIVLGDALDAFPGCAKTFAICQSKFNNLNFGGFPFVKGTDFILSFPDAKS